jgi:hypothetical protein
VGCELVLLHQPGGDFAAYIEAGPERQPAAALTTAQSMVREPAEVAVRAAEHEVRMASRG